jgi:hypothetical protein
MSEISVNCIPTEGVKLVPVVGVLDEPYSAKPAQRSSLVAIPARQATHRKDTVPAYEDWRA